MQDTEHKPLLPFLARIKVYYGRGSSWLQIIINLGIITANIKLFESTIIGLGLPVSMTVMYAAAILSYLLASVIIGLLDAKIGVWQPENDMAWVLTPMANNLCNQVNEIHGDIKKNQKGGV
jgi:hypothetical protein